MAPSRFLIFSPTNTNLQTLWNQITKPPTFQFLQSSNRTQLDHDAQTLPMQAELSYSRYGLLIFQSSSSALSTPLS